MASLQQLQDDVLSYLNRRDCISLIPGWIISTETEIAQTVRARCMVTSAVQNIDAPYIALPDNFGTMESIRDNTTGVILDLKDSWSGNWTDPQQDDRNISSWYNPTPPACSAYRLVANCIEFLPHPAIPDPPDPSWVPQQVLMAWYAKPRPLVLPSDTNPVLETFYQIYLYGVVKRGAIWALDNDRAAQMDAEFSQAVTRADLWKQQSDYSGAPLVEELACQF